MTGFDRLRSNLAQMAQQAAAGFMPARAGLVSSYDPDLYLVKVKLQPEDVETGWLPIAPGMAGKAFGVYFGPAVDDQALIVFLNGDINQGQVVAFLSSDVDVPPKVESGEIHLIAKDAEASIIMKPSGDITSKGKWAHEGPMTISETLEVTQTIHADGEITTDAKVTAEDDITSTGGDVTDKSGVAMNTLRTKFNSHTHPGVQTGGGVTGATLTKAE